MKKILITGGAGFVGSSLAIRLKQKYPQYVVCCLDNLKRRGSELNLPRLAAHGIQFVHGDVRNREDLYALSGITTIIEASAEPSVLAGLDNAPDYLINTNLMGAVNCLYLAAKEKADFIFISTSRVYPIEAVNNISFTEEETRFAFADRQEIKGVTKAGIAEGFPTEGYRSLYGATKLAAEMLIGEFNKFCQVRTVINRCGVLTGPWQMGKVDQGVVVLWVARHFWKKDLGYFGYGGQGKQVRDILHIDDYFTLVDYQIHNMEKLNGRLINVGGGKEVSVSLKELTALCETVSGNSVNIAAVKEDRQADIRIYLTDNALVTALTGWRPTIPAAQIVADVHHWLRENEPMLKPILS
ncbi:MAG TPA: NAD-dependent epimerase/dehydratase family protein [Puia sp.]|jgi:CDP-paratose 2-epimerase|nr:NAD-dependent epimerase/dehydratase family protein [Puia sp.]